MKTITYSINKAFELDRNSTKFLIILIMLFSGTLANGQVELGWAKSMGGTGNEYGNSIAVDVAGNVHTTGYFWGTVDFDPSVGTSALAAFGGKAIFIQKLDAAGNLIWAKSMGGTSSNQGNSIAVDAAGNVYTTGSFWGTVDFDPNVGVNNLTAVGDKDIFVQKLDAVGNLIWAKSIGGVNADEGNSIAVDTTGNVYTTGYFAGTVDFDPNGGTNNLSSIGSSDIFIQKLDALGNFVWAKSMGGANADKGSSIAVDMGSNVYTTGSFNLIADFDPSGGIANLTSVGNDDIFIQKLDASGNLVWAKSMGGTDWDYGYSITLDTSANVYTTGRFTSTADFNPNGGVASLTAIGFNDIFVQKLDAAGNFLWAKSMGGTNGEVGHSIVADPTGNIYVAGEFFGTADFDPGIGVYNLTAVGSYDVFIQKLDTLGNLIWAKSMGGPGLDVGTSIAINSVGNIYTTGHFKDTSDFNPNGGVTNLTAVGGDDIFVQKLQQRGVTGRAYLEYNPNCIQETYEPGLGGRILTINPGNIITTTNNSGIWILDSLPVGNYTVTIDSPTNWLPTCPLTQNLTIVDPSSVTVAPAFGFLSTATCSAPDVSIHAPF